MSGGSEKGVGADRSQVALVTGGHGGIGSAICRSLRHSGYRVAVFDVAEEPGATDVGEWSARVDVADPVAVRTAIDALLRRFGRLDTLVNCAGTASRGSFESTSPEEFMGDLTSNLLGTFLTCQAAVYPTMREAGHGRIINIASASGKRGGIGPVHGDGSGGRSGPGYASAKGAVINLTRWIAREVGQLGITCNAVAPGAIESPLTVGHHYDFTDTPLGRFGTADEVAGAVSWLASAHASYVTGTIIDVDGGASRA